MAKLSPVSSVRPARIRPLRCFRNSLALIGLAGLLLAGCAAPAPGSGHPASRPTATAFIRPTEDPVFTQARMDMVEYSIEQLGVENLDVLRAMRAVPRHLFVPPDYLDEAYENHPLPIGHGQTISQPFIVAWMTELLELQPGDKVLEVGTGSGYQVAVLAELGFVDVYSVEIIPELAEAATARLKALGYLDVRIHQGDGYYGWTDHAPYNAILVTAAPDHLPLPLVQQLADGGRLVIPIGPPGGYQSLWKFVKRGEELKAYNMGGVAFVPFTGPGAERAEPASPAP